MASAEDLLLQFEEVKSEYGAVINEFKEDDRYIRAPWEGTFSSGVIPDDWQDDGLKVLTPPTAQNAIQNASDHVLTVPIISVPIRPTTQDVEKQRDIAEKRKQFHELFWHRVLVDQGDPLRRLKKELVLGKGVLKKVVDWSIVPELADNPTPAQKQKFKRDLKKAAQTKFPWIVSVVPKETVFEDKAKPWAPEYVYEEYETTAIEARSRFTGNEKVESALKDHGPLDVIKYMEYWSAPNGDTPGQFVQWVDGEAIHDAENPYDYVPYAIGDPGFGHVDARNRPEDRYMSLLRPARPMIEAETIYATEMHSLLRMYVWPHLVTKNMPDLDDGTKQIRMGPGGHTDTTEGQEIEVLRFEGVGRDIMAGMERTNQYADEASRFGVLGGFSQRGVDTATEADQHIRNAATILSGIVTAMQRMVMQVNSWSLMDIEMLGVPVTVFGAVKGMPSEITLTSREINGFYYTNVEFDTSDQASLNLRNARTWSDLYQRLPISAYTVLKEAGVANPSAEIDNRTVEDIERAPEAIQLYLLQMLQGFGENGELVRQGVANNIGGQAGQGGAPEQNAADAAPDVIEQLRSQSRQDANATAPERAFQ